MLVYVCVYKYVCISIYMCVSMHDCICIYRNVCIIAYIYIGGEFNKFPDFFLYRHLILS